MPELTSIWPSLLIMSLLLGIAELVGRGFAFYREVVSPGTTGRYLALDGLRGYLAASVIFCHAVTYYIHFRDGGWPWPPSRFYTLLGQVPVILFFMITGFLFWSKVIRGRIPWGAYFRGRFLRIMPLYWFLAIAVLVVVAIESGFQIRVSPARLLVDVTTLSIPGRGWPTINGMNAGTMLAMAWTLRFEWGFYLLLPLLSLCRSHGRFILLCLAVVAAYSTSMRFPSFYSAIRPQYWIIFIFGMCIAQVLPLLPSCGRHARHGLSVLALACVGVVGLQSGDAYCVSSYGFLAVAFFCFAYGADVFGLLTLRASRLLGTISYSVYLLHLLVLHVALQGINRWCPIAQISPCGYWALSGGIAVTVVLVACLTYRYIEHPYLSLASISAARKGKLEADRVEPIVVSCSHSPGRMQQMLPDNQGVPE